VGHSCERVTVFEFFTVCVRHSKKLARVRVAMKARILQTDRPPVMGPFLMSPPGFTKVQLKVGSGPPACC
jgi:hypothetical protein